MKTLIYNGHVIDPANHVDGKLNLLIEDGKIAWAGKGMPEADQVIDAMKSVGDKMDVSLRETAGGGLAQTPEGIEAAKKLLSDN